ncbi:Na/Pi symporter [Aquabacter spiritensis]|uniref:Phosphate:Na+ symporter n=1 Tax=Aquabacter spiritensis TaxID=933073 RepID=A0A4R3M8K9_9HYPH|nr:Na/Pi symporter [Aquabacter spiritensis]TCT07997.1 phosphate:Na+ symporter [Aquabacter spiritensis]
MLAFAELLAGLGLLFVGLKFMSAHLQQAMGRRVRALLKAATRSRLIGFVCGAMTGAIAQSSNAVTLIAANLVRGGVLTTREAIPVVAGANVGTSALVFIAAIDTRIAVLYLVGLVGCSYQFKLDRKPVQREWMGVLLGLALLFLGLELIREAPTTIALKDAAALLSGIGPFLGFGIGLGLALVTQSSSTATVLCVAAVQAEMIGLHDSFFVVLGANFGSGLATLLSAGGLHGTGKQLCFVQIIVRGVGCLVVFLAWAAAAAAGLSGGVTFSSISSGGTSFAISIIFLLLQLSGGLAAIAFLGTTEALARRFSPPNREDHVSRPHFITDDALGHVSTALDLAARETDRLIRHLPDLLPDLDQSGADDAKVRAIQWRGAAAIARATDVFLVELIDRQPVREDLDIALALQHQQGLIEALQDTLKSFADAIDSFPAPPPLAFNLCESLRAIVLELADTRGGSAAEFDLLIALTAERSEILERIRRTLSTAALGTAEEARTLLRALSFFERAVWLVHRLAMTLRPAANEANRDLAGDHLTRDEADAD